MRLHLKLEEWTLEMQKKSQLMGKNVQNLFKNPFAIHPANETAATGTIGSASGTTSRNDNAADGDVGCERESGVSIGSGSSKSSNLLLSWGSPVKRGECCVNSVK